MPCLILTVFLAAGCVKKEEAEYRVNATVVPSEEQDSDPQTEEN